MNELARNEEKEGSFESTHLVVFHVVAADQQDGLLRHLLPLPGPLHLLTSLHVYTGEVTGEDKRGLALYIVVIHLYAFLFSQSNTYIIIII